MSLRAASVSLVTLVTLLVGCVPAVQVTRMGYYPANPPNCPIEVINNVTSAPSFFAMPNSPYEIIGMIGMGDMRTGADPFSPEYIALFRPHVCALGGDAISLMASSTSGAGMMGGGTGTGYAVLRKRGTHPAGTFLVPSAPH